MPYNEMAKAKAPKYKTLPPPPRISLEAREQEWTSQQGRITRREREDQLRRLDFSLNRIEVYQLEPIPERCDCPRCERRYRLLCWPKRNKSLWEGSEGSCLYRVMLHMARICLLTCKPINPNIHEILVRRAI